MKKLNVLIMTLVFIFTMATPSMAAPKVKLPSVNYLNNAYITITDLSAGSVSFQYGIKKPRNIADPIYVSVSLDFVVDNDNLYHYHREEYIVTKNEPLLMSFTKHLRSGEPLIMRMVLRSDPEPGVGIIKTLELAFTPPETKINTTITQSSVVVFQGQPLTLTAKTFLDGSAYVSEEWYYPLYWYYFPDGSLTGYGLGTRVSELTTDGYYVSKLTFDPLLATPGTYTFDYVIFTDLYDGTQFVSQYDVVVVPAS